jgi:flagellar basal-body rod protein FlgF
MQNALYISLSGQIALAKRLDTISNNVANMSTVGFRAEGTNFRTVLADAGQQRLAYVEPVENSIVRTQGNLSSSGNPWDIAVKGSGWIAVRTLAGTAYTRDGRLSLSPDGQLQTVTGLPVLDASLSPIALSPDGGPPVIASDGSLAQAGRQVGAIGLFNLPADARLSRGPAGAVLSSVEGIAVTDGSGTQVAQGFTEASNSNPLSEMTELIRVQRAFEMVSNGMDAIEAAKTDAIKTLGS